jgi:tetratricopeptide (TPR) repeat protein
MRRLVLPAVLLALMLPADLAAQRADLGKAFDLERRGNYAPAADAYRAILATKPGDTAALLGLERVLAAVNQSATILPQARAALALGTRSGAVYGVALRAWAAASEPDSMRAVAETWARAVPGDEAPYREWGAAALAARDLATAAQAYRLGRERLGRQDALAAEMAQLAITEGNYLAAVREWVPAIRRLPGYRVTAVATLSVAPEKIRPALLDTLVRQKDFAARRLEAELRVRWGDPLGGLAALEAALPDSRAVAVEALRGLLDQLRATRTRESLLAQGRTLEAIATRTPEPQASRVRLEAAQAYSAAGELQSARRMLAGMDERPGRGGQLSSSAASTLVEVLIGDGKLREAEHRLEELRPTLASDDYLALRRRVAHAWLRQGDLTRADSMLGADSSVDGLALAGRLKLYRGDLRGAVKDFKEAGPYAGDRGDATWRTSILALLQPIEADSSIELGEALFWLERGDSTRAATELEAVAAKLPIAKGGAELRLLAGRTAAATGRRALAERLFREAAVVEAPATAPAAELALAELLLGEGKKDDAIARLEHLILTYPTSALVPQARRTLDQARGGVPKT